MPWASAMSKLGFFKIFPNLTPFPRRWCVTCTLLLPQSLTLHPLHQIQSQLPKSVVGQLLLMLMLLGRLRFARSLLSLIF
jgi:hypothetical protein